MILKRISNKPVTLSYHTENTFFLYQGIVLVKFLESSLNIQSMSPMMRSIRRVVTVKEALAWVQ